MRCVLLPAPEGGQAPLELELLPPRTLPEEVLQQGQLYEARLSGGARLYWRQQSSLACEHNPLATSLAATQVCGDAVLGLQVQPQAGAAPQLEQEVQRLVARHLRGSQWRLAGSWDGAESGRQAAQQRKRQQQQVLLHQLLRRPSRGAAPALHPDSQVQQQQQQPGMQAASVAAPATPPRQPLAAAAEPAPSSQQQAQERERDRRAACRRHQQHQELQRQHQQHDVHVYACEPRQQLMWTIAGRATSLSWQGAAGPAAATQPPPVGPGPRQPSSEASVAGGGTAPPGAAPAAAPAVPVGACAAPGPAAAAPAGPEQLAVDALPAKHRSSLDRSPWADLQPEILGAVLAQAGHSSTAARTLGQVCASWRRGLAEERSALQQLRFVRLKPLNAGSSSNSSTSSGGGGGSMAGVAASDGPSRTELPWLVQRAIKAGNVAAAVVAARHLELTCRGHDTVGRRAAAAAAGVSDCARCWTRAAKAGHPEGQWKLGLWHYKGMMGMTRDGEEALLWLSRAAKQLADALQSPLAASPAPPADAVANADGTGNASAGTGAAVPQLATAQGPQQRRPPPLLMSYQSCSDILAQAALLLGYLFLDGEGTKVDVAAAIRWFRLAERHGCRVAGRVLGSLYNTGQFA